MRRLQFFMAFMLLTIITLDAADEFMHTYHYDDLPSMTKFMEEHAVGCGFLLNQRHSLKTLTVYTNSLHEIGHHTCQGFAVKEKCNGDFLIYQIQFNYADTHFTIWGNNVVYGEINTWEKIKQQKCHNAYEAYETINRWITDTREHKSFEIRKAN